MLGSMRDNYPFSSNSLAESFSLVDGKWKDFVADKCTFGQRMIGGLNVRKYLPGSDIPLKSIYQHGKFCQQTFGRNPATEQLTNEVIIQCIVANFHGDIHRCIV
jgi:hypothetical protein